MISVTGQKTTDLPKLAAWRQTILAIFFLIQSDLLDVERNEQK